MKKLMERFRDIVIRDCKCIASVCALSAILLPGVPGEVRAEEHSGKKKEGVKFCVIIRPEVKEADSRNLGMARVAPEALAPVSGQNKESFFKGKMGKLGFGVPDCFFIENRDADSVAAERSIHGPVNNLVEGIGEADETRGFFPSAGYYSRSSQEGKMGVAFGVGFGNSAPSSWEEKGAGTPEAKVSLMLGFGF